MMKTYRSTVVADRLGFPEDPRWHHGMLYFSDMDTQTVMRLTQDGAPEPVVHVPGTPSGLGWLPDGRMLVVSMSDQRLLEELEGEYRMRADLSRLAAFHCNDMAVDDEGNAYIGTFGFDFAARAPFRPGRILHVSPIGEARIAADGLSFPNGLAITPDRRTLIVGETLGARLTAFDIQPDGGLANRRIWAELPGTAPDGISLDVTGAVWVASPVSGAVLRVRKGGEVLARAEVSAQPYACRLGGRERRTLFVATSYSLPALFHLLALPAPPEDAASRAPGRIEAVEVEDPGAGFPSA